MHVPSILVKIIDRLYQHMGELFDVGLHIPVISICIHIGIYIYIYNYPRVEFTRFLIISELSSAVYMYIYRERERVSERERENKYRNSWIDLFLGVCVYPRILGTVLCTICLSL